MINFTYPLIVLFIIPICLIFFYYLRPKSKWNIVRVTIKLIVILLILLSITLPYTIEPNEREGMKEIIIIADNTRSMRVFDPGIENEVFNILSNLTPVSMDHISGTNSSIGDSIFKNIKPGGNILLISDGNNNKGRSITEAISFARNINSTIYYLRQEPIKNDMSVSISGDDMSIIDTPFDFYVDINTLGTIEGDLKIYIDGIATDTIHIKQSKRILKEYFFNIPGFHNIRAEVSVNDDEISQNNIFNKSVFVIPKPDILLVSKKESPLSKILDISYSLHTSPDFINPDSYKAVILDDILTSGLSGNDASILSDYIANGGGLVVVGGQNGFTDKDASPLFIQLLPVKPGGDTVRSNKAAVVLVIDISGSTGDLTGDSAKLGIEKGLANQVIESLGADDFIGVIAFNNIPHTIIPLSRYPENSKVRDMISRLTHGGTTHLSTALSTAFEILNTFDGGKNVIVISDGIAADRDAALNVAGSMADRGINLYTIGVGLDTDEVFMKRLASKGNGVYLKRDQSQGIRLLFSEITKPGKLDGFPLILINSYHFITSDVSLNATIYGYNNVFTKQNAQALVMTSTGNPVISTWRFGLGRVICITTDNGNTWAPELYDRDNSRVISRSVNFAIGNPRKNDDNSVFPVGENVPEEYREIGNNDVVPDIIRAAGGRVYNISEIHELIPDIKKKNTEFILERIELAPLFLLAALLLYGAEVIMRRLMEIFR